MQTVQSYTPPGKVESKKKAPRKRFAAFANITEQNASEAAFLWLLRSQAVTSPLYFPADIKELEDRLEANLEGLSVAGELGWQVCVDQLIYEEPGEIFTAAVVALRSRNAARIKMVCELGLRTAAMTKGLISAFGWVEAEIARFWIERFLSVTDPNYRMLGLAVCSARREDPGKYFLTILQDPDLNKYPRTHGRALRLIGELNRHELVPALNAAMGSPHADVRFWANWSAALLGNTAAIQNLKPYLLEPYELADKALYMVFSGLPVNVARKWITEMTEKPVLIRPVIKAIGVLGDPHAVPWLIQQMHQPELARLAGWSFSQITGIDLEAAHLDMDPPAGIETGPSDDIEDEDVSIDADEDLPWPDVRKIAKLWQVHNQLLQAGQRYFQGQEITKQLLAQVFVKANQQQKELAALQRALLDKHTALVNIKARER